MNNRYPYYIANKAQQPNTDLEVTDKYTGEVVSRVALADPDAIEKAIEAAVKAAHSFSSLPAGPRSVHC